MPYTIIKLNPKTYQVQDKNTGKMSHLINKKRKDCFTVINTDTGKVHAKCTSLQNAKAQLRLLYGLESGDWKPTDKKGGMMTDTEDENEMSTQTVPEPVVVPIKETWKGFFSKHAKGKKFASQADSHEFMKKVGQLWRAHKEQKKVVRRMESKAKKAMKLKLKEKKK
jgi:hypothetical protein